MASVGLFQMTNSKCDIIKQTERNEIFELSRASKEM